ncbi:hypothetical protein [Nocardia carnea]|uniref:hypothetical protein n=1 Tax=Nocardia carnea TaxID=37328 RepID=UPI002458C3AC|nr:hypothetical protein [Nocardia carnea]
MTRRTTEWLIVGVCAVLTVVVCVSAAVVLAFRFTDDDSRAEANPATEAPTTTSTTTAAPEVYRIDQVTNTCDLVDFAPLIAYGGGFDKERPARHTENRGDDPMLTCHADLVDGLNSGLVMLDITADGKYRSSREAYESGKQIFGTPTVDGEKTGAVTELGQEGYFTLREHRNTFYEDDVNVDYRATVLDANITVTMSVHLSSFGKRLTGDVAAGLVQAQIRAILTKLRR